MKIANCHQNENCGSGLSLDTVVLGDYPTTFRISRQVNAIPWVPETSVFTFELPPSSRTSISANIKQQVETKQSLDCFLQCYSKSLVNLNDWPSAFAIKHFSCLGSALQPRYQAV
jgi:hypothetical protein